MSRLRAAAALLFTLLASPARAGDAGTIDAAASDAPPAQLSLTLGVVPVVLLPDHPEASLAEGARITLESAEPPVAAELRRRHLDPRGEDGRLVLDVASYPTSSEAPTRQHRSPSFLMDYDEPDVKSVHAQVETDLGKKPGVDALVAFVRGYVVNKDLRHAIEPASITARHREGDCTEHALLLGALARSFGHAARGVLGIVLIRHQGLLFAAQHMWVEWHDGRHWVLADAALPAEVQPFYVPLAVLREEGPGYGRGLNESGAAHVSRVTIGALPGVKRR